MRGRVTGTRRPPRGTEPGPRPWRTAVRSGLCRSRGPQATVTSASIMAVSTRMPAPTARASRPSRRSVVISPNAMLTCSGTAIRVVSILVVW